MWEKAFTLAEVLITLTVIGIIAAIVIPGLIQNTQDQQYKVAWKKTYAELDQATRKLSFDTGGSLKNLCTNDDDECLANLYKPYLNYLRACDVSSFKGTCWHNDNSWKWRSGNPKDDTGSTFAGIILNDSTLLGFYNDKIEACDGAISGTLKYCALIDVDINGFKGPNQISKDIYRVYILENRILPIGYGNSASCEDQWGLRCSAEYLYR